MVIFPVLDTDGLAGVILNSLSVRLSRLRPVVGDDWALVDEEAAGAELLELLLDDPQPAISAAMSAKGASFAGERMCL